MIALTNVLLTPVKGEMEAGLVKKKLTTAQC